MLHTQTTTATTKITTIGKHFIAVLLIFFICIPTATWALSDKRLCADPKCETIISLGTAKISYTAAEEGMISFKINSLMRVLSKSAGNDTRLWGVDCNGRRGYANKDFIMEKKIYVSEKKLDHIVPVVLLGSKPAESELPTATAQQLKQENAAEQEPVAEQKQSATELKPENTTEQPQQQPVADQIKSESNSEKEAAAAQLTPESNSEKAAAAAQLTPESKTEEDTAQLKPDESLSETTTTNPIISEIKTASEQIQTEIAKEQATEAQPVLNASEIIDATADLNINSTETTTTSPLEVNVETVDSQPVNIENINIENVEKLVQTTPVVQKVEIVDGTEIPLEELATNDALPYEDNDVNDNDNSDDDDFDYEGDDEDDSDEEIEKEILKITEKEIEKQILEEDKVANDTAAHIDDSVVLENVNTSNKEELVAAEMVEEVTVDKPVSNEALPSIPSIDIVEKLENVVAVETAEEKTAENNENISENADAAKDLLNEIPLKETNADVAATTVEQLQAETIMENNNSEENIINKVEVTTEVPITNEASVSVETTEAIQQTETTTQTIPSTLDNETPKTENQLEETSKEATLVENEQKTSEDYAQQKLIEEENPEIIVTQTDKLPPVLDQTEAQQNADNQHASAEHYDPYLVYKNNAAEETAYTTPDTVNILHDPYHYTTPTYNNEAIHVTTEAPELLPTATNDNDYNNKAELPSVKETSENIIETHETVYKPTSPPAQPQVTNEPEPVVLPSTSPDAELIKEGNGLYATILGTVNSFLSNNKNQNNLREQFEAEPNLDKILYPDSSSVSKNTYQDNAAASQHCFKPAETNEEEVPMSVDKFLELIMISVLDNSQILLCVTIAAASSLFFIFGYYCFCNSSNEGALLSKLNILERSLLASHKENSILKHDIMTTRAKLSSIEDNSFGSNDMVISLKKQLEEEMLDKAKLQEQVKVLEKDLVSAADAGLELNKYVSELLSNQNGDETIKDTVEELQRQLNEQDHTIREINASLAEKSRENSELQLSLAEQNARLTSDLGILQQDNDELEAEKANLQTRIEQLTTEFEQNLNQALEGKNYEIQRMQNHILEINTKWEREHSELQTSLAKIEALEDCLKNLKKDSSVNMTEVISTANLRGELAAVQKKYSALKAHLNTERESKVGAENQLKAFSAEIENLKKEYNQSEKDKLDAQTRLEVLSTYFKEKEAQLQKDLSIKEAMWLKQQGEKTGTVDKITGLQQEIQTLKSQNDELRAEIEAQLASHKAQTGILQNRVHEHYLSARQAERRYDEARNEAAVLRSQLTAMANSNNNAGAGDDLANNSGSDTHHKTDLKDAPSPIPGSPFFPPPLPFLPPQAFLGASHFMGLPPPPPFLPPTAEDLRPAPLGRMRSPTLLRSGRYSPAPDERRSGRYSPRDDYSDYDDYYDYDDDRLPPPPRRNWQQRDSYSPPRTYRSLSPTESRYNGADTENDYSPPASPRSDRLPPQQRHINEV